MGKLICIVAAFSASIGAVEGLLAVGADPNVRNRDGHTPLTFAMEGNARTEWLRQQTIALLRQAGGVL